MNNIQLSSFFIFNPLLISSKKKPDENEQSDAKSIYFYPEVKDEKDLNKKRFANDIIQGCFDFYSEFEGKLRKESFISDISNKNQNITTISNNLIFVEFGEEVVVGKEFENNIYVCLKVIYDKNPFTFKENFKARKKNFLHLLTNLYETLIIYHGKIEKLIQPDEVFVKKNNKLQNEELKQLWKKIYSQILNEFVEMYFKSINIGKNYVPYLKYLSYFPQGESNYTPILLACRRLKEKIPEVNYFSVFFNGLLLHNEISFSNIALLYNHFFYNLDSSIKYKHFYNPTTQKIQTISSGYDEGNFPSDTSFFKGFENNQNTYHLIGLSSLNLNNYQMFIPKLYLDGEIVQMVVFIREKFVIFFFLNEKFDPRLQISKLLGIDKWIRRYLDDELTIFKELYDLKISIVDEEKFIYINESNFSLKISSKFFEKGHIINLELIEPLLEAMSKISKTSIIRLKGYYMFLFLVINRKVAFFISTNYDLKQASKIVDDCRKRLFDHIFI